LRVVDVEGVALKPSAPATPAQPPAGNKPQAAPVPPP
jgi:hypothetical protein